MAKNTKAVKQFKKEMVDTLLAEYPDAVGVAQQVQQYRMMYGKLRFNPEPLNAHHKRSGRCVVLELEETGYAEVHRWLFQKHTGMQLVKPQRDDHITIVSWYESHNINEESWNHWSKHNEGACYPIELHPTTSDPGFGYWWMPVKEQFRSVLHELRVELGLEERPLSGLHLTVGSVKPGEQNTSDYWARKYICPKRITVSTSI